VTRPKDEPEWLPASMVRKARPPAKIRQTGLSQAEEDELAAAKANKRTHVGPGVAAYMLGISKDTLKKRRQRGAGLVPDHVAAKSNRDGAAYVWASVVRCAGAERFDQNVLVERTDVLKQRTDALDKQSDALAAAVDALRFALRLQGAGGLEQEISWATSSDRRIMGLAALHPTLPATPMSLLEALQAHWSSDAVRQPYHQVAVELLSSAERAVSKNLD